MSKAKDNMYTAMRWFDEHSDLTVEEKVVYVYELWQNFRIDDDEEEELYRYVDPQNLVDNPAKLWWCYDKEIPDVVSEQIRIENLNVLKEMIK